MKRIIVCLDGTWNDADGGGMPTNVVRIRDALRSKGEDGQVFQRLPHRRRYAGACEEQEP